MKSLKGEAMARRRHILEEISTERDHQCLRYSEEFDHKNTLSDWIAFITIQLGRSAETAASKSEQRTRMVKVAALAVAAVEAFDRRNEFGARHYDVVEDEPLSTHRSLAELEKDLETANPKKIASNELLTNAERHLKQERDFKNRLDKDATS